MNNFFTDVDTFVVVDSWLVNVDECLGTGSAEIEATSQHAKLLSDQDFRQKYAGIYQTIDGKFQAFHKGQEQASFLAIDSTSWDISGPPSFEKHMTEKYGCHTKSDA